MKVCDIQSVLLNEVVIIYMEQDSLSPDSYIDLFKGFSSDIPERYLDMTVRFIFPGSKRKKGPYINICVI